MTRWARLFVAATISLVLLLVLAPAVPAQERLPVGQAAGVKVSSAGGNVVVTFTRRAARLYRSRVAARKITVRCVDLPMPALGLELTRTQEETFRAPRRRRPLRLGFPPVARTSAGYCAREPSSSARANGSPCWSGRWSPSRSPRGARSISTRR